MPNISKLSKFLKPKYVKDGDVIYFKEAGHIINKSFKNNSGIDEIKSVLEMAVEVNGELKIYCPNQTSIDYLNEAWGDVTENWVGKQGRMTVLRSSNGKDMIITKPI